MCISIGYVVLPGFSSYSWDSHRTPRILIVLPRFQGFPLYSHGSEILGIRLFPQGVSFLPFYNDLLRISGFSRAENRRRFLVLRNEKPQRVLILRSEKSQRFSGPEDQKTIKGFRRSGTEPETDTSTYSSLQNLPNGQLTYIQQKVQVRQITCV